VRVPRFVLPLVVGVAGLSVLITGVAGASGIRSDRAAEQRAVAAAALQAKQEQAFRDALRPVAERVYDHVQPLQDAFDAFDKPSPDDKAVRDDVLGHGGAADAVGRERAALAALSSPASLTKARADLDDALGKLVDVATMLTAATKQRGDKDGVVEGFEDAIPFLGVAEQAWDTAVVDLYLGKGAPPPTAASRTEGPVVKAPRPPRSKGAYLYAVDRICGSADTAFAKLPDVDDAGDFLKVAPKEAALVRTTAGRLKAVPLPEADADRLTKEVLGPLTGFVATASALEEFAAAVRGRDRRKGTVALDHLSDAYAEQAALAKAFRSYGATVCGVDLDVKVPRKSGSSSDDTVAT
jgi:hypothetical protein